MSSAESTIAQTEEKTLRFFLVVSGRGTGTEFGDSHKKQAETDQFPEADWFVDLGSAIGSRKQGGKIQLLQPILVET